MTEEMIRLRIGKQLESKSKLEYDLAAREQDCANLRTLIEGCDSNIRGLEQARSVVAEMEREMAEVYARTAHPPSAKEMAAQMAEEEWMERGGPPPPRREPAPAKSKPQKAKPAKAQAPRPAKRRGRPPKAKPEPIQDEPTQAGGSWNGNGGLTPEQAAAQ